VTEPTYITDTRMSYDTVAVNYGQKLKDALAERPLDRALLTAFAELAPGRIAEVGCGPGYVSAYLDSLGAQVFGVDLSPGMVEVATQTYPHLEFRVGTMDALDIEDSALGGIVAWFSIIHTPPERLPAVFAEFDRVLAPGGHVLLSFPVGENEARHVTQGYDHTVSLIAYRWSPDHIVEALGDAGIAVVARTIREPEEPGKPHLAFILATKT
jgi:SAM-dependent methyltransferase